MKHSDFLKKYNIKENKEISTRSDLLDALREGLISLKEIDEKQDEEICLAAIEYDSHQLSDVIRCYQTN